MRRLPTRTKIVATLGPASQSLARIRALLRAGTDIFRINFSHGTHAEHQRAIELVRSAAEREEDCVGILADLQGPKIRLGPFRGGEPFFLKRGQSLILVAGSSVLGVPGRVSCTYAGLARDVKDGDSLLLDDGNIELKVVGVLKNEVHTRVRYGGLLRQFKGVSLAGARLRARSLSRKDLLDLAFALKQRVDFVALSFVQSARDVELLQRRILDAGSAAQVIAKIERPEAVRDIAGIVSAADGIMIARGDMGVELGPDAVPSIQKSIIQRCLVHAKPVITATQMLESMIEKPRPTRAEVSDVANAIHDGTSAVMLSAETATGKYPILCVRTMDRVARRTEADLFHGVGRRWEVGALSREPRSISEATVRAAANAARDVRAHAIVTFTETGRTAGLVARERIPMRIVAFTPHEHTRRRLTLQWGIIPQHIPPCRSVEEMHQYAESRLLKLGLVRRGDRVVLIAGAVRVSGATNSILIRAF